MANKNVSNKDSSKIDKKVLFAIFVAAFGVILFIALALTLPWS